MKILLNVNYFFVIAILLISQKSSECLPLKEKIIVKLVIAGEAGGEGKKGLYHVACVIQNRMRIKNKTSYEIVTQKSQFSAYNHLSNTQKTLMYLKNKKYIDYLYKNLGKLKDITGGATHYWNPRIYKNFIPCWVPVAKQTKIFKNHNFYFYRYF